MTQIIKAAKTLRKEAELQLKAYKSVGERLHAVIVSSIWHACTHGDPSILNFVYTGLRSNDQTAVKMYIRRAMIINGRPKGDSPEKLTTEEINQALLQGSVFGYEKGQFTVIAGHTSDEAKGLRSLCEKRFINPDGETDRMVFDRNNFAEVKTLDDQAVLSKLAQVIKETEKETDTRKVAISASTQKLLKDLKTKVATQLNQHELAA